MLGFLVGTACLIGLISMIRRGRHGRFGRFGHGGWGRGGWGRRAFLNRLFMKLETSPSQENVIVGALDQVREKARSLRPELDATRGDLARLLGEESFDAERLGAIYARHDEAMQQMRGAITDAIGQVHGALDSEQRRRLAEILERRFGWGRGGHSPYRSAVSI